MTIWSICQSLLAAESEAAFAACLEQAAHEMSAGYFGLIYAFKQEAARPGAAAMHHERQSVWLSNVPPTVDPYLDKTAGLADPVIRHVKRSSLPIVWNRDTYRTADCLGLWEEMYPYGFNSGAATSLYLPDNSFFSFGVDTTEEWAFEQPHVTQKLADLALVTSYAQCAAESIFRPPLKARNRSPLSARESEVLAWASEGKTAWETGQILNIGQSTVNKHIDAAVRRMNCVSKTQAVARALRAGWI